MTTFGKFVTQSKECHNENNYEPMSVSVTGDFTEGLDENIASDPMLSEVNKYTDADKEVYELEKSKDLADDLANSENLPTTESVLKLTTKVQNAMSRLELLGVRVNSQKVVMGIESTFSSTPLMTAKLVREGVWDAMGTAKDKVVKWFKEMWNKFRGWLSKNLGIFRTSAEKAKKIQETLGKMKNKKVKENIEISDQYLLVRTCKQGPQGYEYGLVNLLNAVGGIGNAIIYANKDKFGDKIPEAFKVDHTLNNKKKNPQEAPNTPKPQGGETPATPPENPAGGNEILEEVSETGTGAGSGGTGQGTQNQNAQQQKKSGLVKADFGKIKTVDDVINAYADAFAGITDENLKKEIAEKILEVKNSNTKTKKKHKQINDLFNNRATTSESYFNLTTESENDLDRYARQLISTVTNTINNNPNANVDAVIDNASDSILRSIQGNSGKQEALYKAQNIAKDQGGAAKTAINQQQHQTAVTTMSNLVSGIYNSFINAVRNDISSGDYSVTSQMRLSSIINNQASMPRTGDQMVDEFIRLNYSRVMNTLEDEIISEFRSSRGNLDAMNRNEVIRMALSPLGKDAGDMLSTLNSESFLSFSTVARENTPTSDGTGTGVQTPQNNLQQTQVPQQQITKASEELDDIDNGIYEYFAQNQKVLNTEYNIAVNYNPVAGEDANTTYESNEVIAFVPDHNLECVGVVLSRQENDKRAKIERMKITIKDVSEKESYSKPSLSDLENFIKACCQAVSKLSGLESKVSKAVNDINKIADTIDKFDKDQQTGSQSSTLAAPNNDDDNNDKNKGGTKIGTDAYRKLGECVKLMAKTTSMSKMLVLVAAEALSFIESEDDSVNN